MTSEEMELMNGAVERLQLKFEGLFNSETIERCVEDSRQKLASEATISMWLPVLIERLTNDRLTGLARLESSAGARPGVLFLCDHNAGRSQMAAGWMRHLAGDRVDVFSGGSSPSADSNRRVVETMAEVGIDISNEYPKPWTDEVMRGADVIVTMGCGEACPILEGKRYVDWDIPSPRRLNPDELAEVRDDVRTRVEALMATLGVLS
ncbi:arsenate reductase ArsC [Ilumatobacter nonamiensis]|uniref:arsenate reductase ArsC n=1 Tax=Ilumatobacter nonamiensis TaxID=467093 RepID=UPI000344DCDD|nr:arsenate reductase ArsC [Ilumatobacter nonamiensis]